ncbi:MAG: hypothetical protein WC402_05785 [Candidatus Pacearchaeota archaeon]|jgi:hypothetical protein
MRKLYSVLIMALLVLSVAPAVLAVSVGSGVQPEITTEDFKPIVWLCDNRVVYDDATEPGRISRDGTSMTERVNNYAFEGEQVQWKVLVMDKNGINKVEDVFATIGSAQGAGNDIEANCVEDLGTTTILPACNARILEENITTFKPLVMRYYNCLLTVEPTMYGEYWITVEATDLSGQSGTMDENEYWFLNPIIALSIDGTMSFDNVRPGTSSYSSTMLVGNDADASSAVMMDMFISGTDFYDSTSSGAMCPTSNQLKLENFKYYTVNGAYSTKQDPRADNEGYVSVGYGIGFNNPNTFYSTSPTTGYEILHAAYDGTYWRANTLAPGAEMAVTFKLNMPEPCNGNFDSGSIYFWGEAI